jgi:hypothetical protein
MIQEPAVAILPLTRRLPRALARLDFVYRLGLCVLLSP